jgi:YjbE family integral membrane protein
MSEISALGFDQPSFWLQVLEIIGVNILLSGDNAVVIAMACRNLSPRARNWGIAIGSAVAVVLLIVFTGIVATILTWPWLKLVGSLALLYIAIDLVHTNEDDDKDINASDKLWHAVMTVVIADIVMSLDNVVAIAAVAKGNWILLTLGLTVSIPLIVVGAALITGVFVRWPFLIWVGAGLLGWVAGGLLIEDPAFEHYLHFTPSEPLQYIVAAAGAAFVLAVGYIRHQMSLQGEKAHKKPKRVAKKQLVSNHRRQKTRVAAKRR